MTEPKKTQKTFLNKIFESISPSETMMFLGLIVILGLFLGVFIGGGKFLILLKDSEVSRGLITFLIALTTVLLAIVLTLYAITAEDNNKDVIKERFSLGKDVLTTLVGILGTVLGFYFGTADKTLPNQLDVAGIHYKGQQLMTHVSGGTPPYRYSITADGMSFSNVEGRISKDGWILETLNKQPPSGTPITIQVSDARDKSVSLESNYPVEQTAEKPSQVAASSPPATQTASPKTNKP